MVYYLVYRSLGLQHAINIPVYGTGDNSINLRVAMST